MKKWISVLCALVLCLGMAPARAAAAQTFPDIDLQTEVGKAAQKLADAGVINGYSDGKFHAEAQLTRAEFVKIANLTFGLRLTDESIADFTDVAKTHWAYSQIQIARKAGYIQGAGGNAFLPGGIVTRQEVCIMVGRIQNFQNLTGFPVEITDSVDSWAKAAVENAIACGLFTLSADGRFRGTEPITRGEVCVALAQYVTVGNEPVKPGDSGSSGSDGTGGDTDPGGELTEEQKEEVRIAGYIQKMVDKYQKIKPKLGDYTDSQTVKDNMDVLMDCMQRALDARAGGVFLTREYIDKTFSTEIQKFKTAYQKLTPREETDIKSIVADLAYMDEIEAVMDYFGVSLKQ